MVSFHPSHPANFLFVEPNRERIAQKYERLGVSWSEIATLTIPRLRAEHELTDNEVARRNSTKSGDLMKVTVLANPKDRDDALRGADLAAWTKSTGLPLAVAAKALIEARKELISSTRRSTVCL
jgi:hypothetical protein